ncbi:hypothetical protein DK847_19385 [Aestuariivirga litoralis]|uniref:O-antigen ligase domain-containing protein n=1 Tax=Aestuariivirga litoralis TaxID=2650924 RepID=A0A2W2C520_9HYPH|nr:O-antigen ligase family protein [Aestuariivirga litoralis]PZF75263.1 hypothetical protein DK847_19385 [Aestuariivirga litoralis]
MNSATWDESFDAEPRVPQAAVRLATPVLLLIIALVMPPETSVALGPLRLSPYRVLLLILFIPNISYILSGKAGPLNGIDLAIILHSIWCVIAFAAYGGGEQALESGGIYFVECFGAYAMGRRYIRSAKDYQAMSLAVALVVCGLLAVALPESVTHVHFLREAFRGAVGGPALPIIEPRLGLARAFGSFEHPILFGVFCSMAFANAWFAARAGLSRFHGWLLVGSIVLASFVSLSAGAWLMLGLQIALAVWDRVTRGLPGRWAVLGAAFIGVLVVVSMLSNRSPIKVFISYASFSAQSSYNRILIWDYGTAEVGRHPLLGIGLGEWIRAPWMSSSMDNFWLVVAVRYGMPALIFLAAAILLIVFRAASQRNRPEAWTNCRLGWISTIAATSVAACTVHLWNNTFCFFMFMIGCGAWLIDKPRHAAPEDDYDYDETPYDGDYHGAR